MKNFVRIFSLVLALLMLASCFVACGKKDDDNSGSGNGAQTTAGVVATTEGEYVSKLPDELDWGGEEYLVLGQNDQGNTAWKTFEIAREELPDDIVGKAVWERNDAIKNKYNLLITEELVSMSYNHIQTYYASNEDKYDMVMYQLIGLFSHIQDGYLHDLTTLNYVDFDHPTWNDYTNSQLTLGTSIYAVNSKFNLQNKAQTYTIAYNREMARDAGDGYFEDLVANNEWTLDKFGELVKAYAEDTGGNGTKGDYENDTFGLCGDTDNYLGYIVGAGYRASTVVDGVVQLAGAGDQILSILEKTANFYFDSQSNFQTQSVKPLDYGRSVKMFQDGRSLFMSAQVCDYDRNFMDLGFELGVLPYPKYDANQEEFYTQVNYVYSSLSAIPMTVVDTDLAGFGLEVLAEYSVNTTYETYIETKCKLQDSFDQRMSDMYEIIFKNPVYDLVIVGDFGNIRRAVISEVPTAGNASRYATLYNKRYETAQDEIDEIMSDLGIVA